MPLFFEPLLPSDEWQAAGVHWHAFAEAREMGRTLDRAGRRESKPQVVLWSPWEVARWIDELTRATVTHRKVWSFGERRWVEIGDEDDLEHLRRENFLIACRGDSIHTDIYGEPVHHDLYVEAVPHALCRHGCAPDKSR